MIRIVCTFILLVSALGLGAQERVRIEGRVFEDRNGNGLYDRGDRPLRDIPVGNGVGYVPTDRQGRFVTEAVRGDALFVLLPPQWSIADERGHRSTRLVYLDPEGDLPGEVLFPCVKAVKPRTVRVAAVGDVQTNPDETDYAARTVFSELSLREDVDLCIFLGDMVNNNTGDLPLSGAMTDKLPCESYSVIGNHDRLPTQEDDMRRQEVAFNRVFGGSNYAFRRGDVWFVVVDNVYPDGRVEYSGGFSDEGLEFLRATFGLIPSKAAAVVSMHIPLAAARRGRDEFLDMLNAREGETLLLSGHTHQIARHIHGERVQELTAGSVCGSWWRGERDYFGTPQTIQQCGAPHNYFVVDFAADGSYTLRYKGLGRDESYCADITAGEPEEDGGRELVVNIFGGCDLTRAEMSLDGGEWTELVHDKRTAPVVERVRRLYRSKVLPSANGTLLPLRRQASPHIWSGRLPSGLAPGVHKVEVRAEDDRGFRCRAARVFVF